MQILIPFMTRMNNLILGDIVLLKFPFTDGKTFKKRPALVIKEDEDGDIIVVRITSKIYESDFDIYIEDWKKCGLKLPSVIRVHKIATLKSELIDLKMGNVNEKVKEMVRHLINKITV
jgi:mRNA interferase MazF